MTEIPGPEVVYRASPEERDKGRLAALEDHILVARALSGNPVGFEVLMERYTPIVIAFLRGKTNGPSDTEDLCQEVFLTAYRKLGRLRSSDRFGGWLLQIARNKLIDYYRRQHRRPRLISTDDTSDQKLDPLEKAPHPGSGPDQAAADSELQSLVVREIGKLPVRYQTPLTMRLIGESPTHEIAQALGVKEVTVRMRVHRGLKLLRKALKRAGIGPESTG